MPGRRQGWLGPPVWVALAACALAIAAGLWLAFYPDFYQGVSATATSGGAVVQRSEHASLIAENGAWVVGLLVVPVILSGFGLLGVVKRYRLLAWGAALVLLAFSILSGFSIGLFYAPSAVALLVAATLYNSPRTSSRI